MNQGPRDLAQEDYIRHKLYAGRKSLLRRYSDLVVGEGSLGSLLKYELITTLFGSLPGALGLVLRRIFYPFLFRSTGSGVIFGRGLTIRNAQKITLGNRVLIDDQCLIDARGGGDEGVVIGDETVLHRGVAVQAKIGPIKIGSFSDIGACSAIFSQGSTYIGDMVTLGGYCKIGGGSLRLDFDAPESDVFVSSHDFAARGQQRISRGPIRIGDRCVMATGVTILDGVEVGPGTVVGACALIREDVPEQSVVMPHQRLAVVSRSSFRTSLARDDSSAERTAGSAEELRLDGVPQGKIEAQVASAEPILQTVLRSVELLNQQLPPEARIPLEVDASLIEPHGPVDSLGLINLVVALEDAVLEAHGVRIALVDSVSTKAERHPFETVGTLAAHVGVLLEAACLKAPAQRP